MMRRLSVITLLALAGCNSQEQSPAPEAEPTSSAAPAPSLTPQPTPTQDLSALESRDCRTVAQAYFDALARRDFAFAARVWDDPVVDAARLEALFTGYHEPTVKVASVQEEGAAGSLYCTVSGALTDAADPATHLRQGEIVLRRVNDVPGATPEQLRWTVRSSTFIEKMERSGRGAPA